MSLDIRFSDFDWPRGPYPSLAFCEENRKKFEGIINSDEFGFFHVNKEKELLRESERIYEKFKHKKYFVHVGIGGSSLGAEMLVQSLGKRPFKDNIFFLNNVDPDETQEILEKIDGGDTLFYIVSKSGGTAETLAALALILNYLKENGNDESLSESLVFATDPNEGQLKEIAASLKIETLMIPKNIGGRFCVLTPVSYLPALFASLDFSKLCVGAESIKEKLLKDDFEDNILMKSASYLYFLKKELKVNQTVLMPYSSKLKSLSQWFIQLWAESLGKKKSLRGEDVFEGLTPLGAYGATDQHSQMQLFMEGPKDKCLLFVEVENFKHDFKLKSPFSQSSFLKLKDHSLGDLLKAQLKGTMKALERERRPFIHLKIKELNEESMGALLVYFQSLTVLMGNFLNINPFNQPGVELGKKYSFEFLSKEY